MELNLLVGERHAHHGHVLARARKLLREPHAVPTLGDLRTRRTQAEQHAAARQLVDRGGGHGGHGRTSRRDLEDAGPQLDAARAGGQPGQHRRGVRSVRLSGPDRVVAELLGGACDVELVGGGQTKAPVADRDAELHNSECMAGSYRPLTRSVIRNTLSETITATTAVETSVVGRWLTSVPISPRSRQKMTSGIKANGIPNDSTTWLSTSARVGSSPTPITISAGAIVIARRRNNGIWRWMNPCITNWPASVPTDEEDRPEARRPSPKNMSEPFPSWTPRPRNAWSRVSTETPRPWKTAAAMVSMAMLISPARPMAMITSHFSKLKIFSCSASVAPTTRLCVRAECK